MQALLSLSPGGPECLSIGDFPDPVPAAGEVLVRVRACGVNFPDSLIIQDKYQYHPVRPFAPGAEIAGIVESVGEGVYWPKAGDRVFAMIGWGGMAEKAIARADQCVALPEGMSFEDGATFLMTYGTAYHALKQRAALHAGETVLVLGAAGGVGLAAVQLARAMGADVVAAASTQEKLDLAIEHGAARGFLYPRSAADADPRQLSALIKENGGKNGFDVVIDIVGGALSEAACRALAWKGRLLILGFAGGVPKLPLNILLLKGASAVGVFYGTFTESERELNRANNAALADLYVRGEIRPTVSARYALAEGGSAIAALASREVKGKLVIILDD